MFHFIFNGFPASAKPLTIASNTGFELSFRGANENTQLPVTTEVTPCLTRDSAIGGIELN